MRIPSILLFGELLLRLRDYYYYYHCCCYCYCYYFYSCFYYYCYYYYATPPLWVMVEPPCEYMNCAPPLHRELNQPAR